MAKLAEVYYLEDQIKEVEKELEPINEQLRILYDAKTQAEKGIKKATVDLMVFENSLLETENQIPPIELERDERKSILAELEEKTKDAVKGGRLPLRWDDDRLQDLSIADRLFSQPVVDEINEELKKTDTPDCQATVSLGGTEDGEMEMGDEEEAA